MWGEGGCSDFVLCFGVFVELGGALCFGVLKGLGVGEGGCFDFVCVLGFGVVLVGALCFGLCYLFCCELRSASCFSVLKG